MATPSADQTTYEALSTLERSKLNIPARVLQEITRGTLAREDPQSLDTFTAALECSCAAFAQEILTGPPGWPYEGRFLIGPHHEEWDELVQNHLRLCILAPRDHSKTFFFDFAYPLWKAATVQNGIGYIFSATQDQAIRILGDIKAEIENNPKLQHLLPSTSFGKGKRWSSTVIHLANGHRIYARGFGTKVRGAHPGWIVVDDGLNDETAYSELVRKKQTEYFYTAISNMIIPGGQIIVVGTPFACGDLYGDLSKNPEYLFRRYQALNGPNETPLWPARYSRSRLKQKQREIGALRFAREFQCCRPGTFIETKNGAVPIEKIEVGDLVLSHTGAWRRVTKTMTNYHSGELIRVKGELHVTPNHPVLTPDGWVAAEFLVGNDQVTFPVSSGKSPVSKISLVIETNVPFLRTREGKRVYSRGSAKQLSSGSVGKAGSKSIPEFLELDKDLLYLFGLWVAEGYVGAEGRLCTFCFGAHEGDTLVATARRIAEAKFGIVTKVVLQPNNGTCLLLICNHILGDFLQRTFGKTASTKRVPPWIRDLDPDLIWSFCLGYLDGDGHVDTEGTARFSSVSDMLLRDVRFLLSRCGFFSVLRLANPGGPSLVQGRLCFRKPSWVLSLSGGGYHAFQERRMFGRSYSWSRIHNTLQRIPYYGPVYNLEVAVNHSYIADGVAVHNCDPVSDDSSLFPLALFKGEPTEQFAIRLGMPHSFWEQAGVTAFIGVDFAMSSSAQADYMVIWTMGLDKFGNRWIMDIQRGKGLSYQRQLSMINDAGRKYQPALIFLEANQMQRIFGDELIRTTDLPIRKFVTTAVKHALDKGVPSLRVLLENGKFRIPRGDQHSIEMTDIWIEEMRAMTWADGQLKSVGRHDDTNMACWICDQAVKAGGFSFDFGEDVTAGGDLDVMLAQENAETPTTPVAENLQETENRIRAALGLEEVEPKAAAGNLVDDDGGGGNPFDAGGAPSPDMLRNFW